jgi:hypothetical protein
MKLQTNEILSNFPQINSGLILSFFQITELKRIGQFLLMVISIAMLFPFFSQKMKNTEVYAQDEKKKSIFDKFNFKKIAAYTFSIFWLGILIYSLSLFDWQTLYSTFTQKSKWMEMFKVSSFILGGLSIFFSTISFLLYSKFLLLLIVLTVIGTIAIFGLNFMASDFLKEAGKSKMDWIAAFIPVSWMGIAKNIKSEDQKLKNTFEDLYKNISQILPKMVMFSAMLAVQLCLIGNLAKRMEISFAMLLPMLFFVNWAYNFSTLFCKFFIFKLLDQKIEKGDKSEIRDVSYGELKENYPDICLYSLKLTFCTFFGSISGICKIFSDSKTNLFFKTAEYLDSILEIASKCGDFFIDQAVFNHGIQPIADIPNLTQSVFSKGGVLLMKLFSSKTFALKIALNFSFLGYFFNNSDFIRKAMESSIPMGFESFGLFDLIFKRISVVSIAVLIFYLLISNLILALESSYIMNTKLEVEKEFENSRREVKIIAKAADKVETGNKVVNFATNMALGAAGKFFGGAVYASKFLFSSYFNHKIDSLQDEEDILK